MKLTATLPFVALLASLPFFAGGASGDGVGIACRSGADARTWTIDPEHSTVLFRAVHMGAGPVWGRFDKVSGTFRIDGADLAGSFVKIEIDAASVNSNSEGRDKHLRNQDFLNVGQFPKITFESTAVRAAEGGYEIDGKIAFRGTTKKVTAKVEHIGTAELNARMGPRSGYEAIFTIKRTEFGSTYGVEAGWLGDEVRLVAGIEGMQKR